MLAAGPIAPAWIVFPIALLTMIVIAAHIGGLARAEMPPSRRRIRKANGWLMLFLVIAIACAAGLQTGQRLFVMLWMLVAGLTGVVLILAWIDALNSLRLHRRDREVLRRHMRGLVAARIPADKHSGPGPAAGPGFSAPFGGAEQGPDDRSSR